MLKTTFLLFLLLLTATLHAAPADDASLAHLQVFPPTDPWNTDISRTPVDPRSATLLASIAPTTPLHPDFGTQYGIPFQFVDASTPRHLPIFQYGTESDKGPYALPDNPLIEGVLAAGPDAPGDRHLLCIDPATHTLYELWHAQLVDHHWHAGSGAIFTLTKPSTSQRPQGITSADAGGLPIFPGLARYDELVLRKLLTHALRFTLVRTRRAYVSPASHFASKSDDSALPPMGMRLRLKASIDLTPFPTEVQVLLAGLKKYGMILADNGSNLFISGAPDPRWNDDHLATLKRLHTTDFDVVQMAEPRTR